MSEIAAHIQEIHELAERVKDMEQFGAVTVDVKVNLLLCKLLAMLIQKL